MFFTEYFNVKVYLFYWTAFMVYWKCEFFFLYTFFQINVLYMQQQLQQLQNVRGSITMWIKHDFLDYSFLLNTIRQKHIHSLFFVLITDSNRRHVVPVAVICHVVLLICLLVVKWYESWSHTSTRLLTESYLNSMPCLGICFIILNKL